jgi:hypothetical protein
MPSGSSRRNPAAWSIAWASQMTWRLTRPGRAAAAPRRAERTRSAQRPPGHASPPALPCLRLLYGASGLCCLSWHACGPARRHAVATAPWYCLILLESPGADRLTAEDRRGLTPLFWAHVAPYAYSGPDVTVRSGGEGQQGGGSLGSPGSAASHSSRKLQEVSTPRIGGRQRVRASTVHALDGDTCCASKVPDLVSAVESGPEDTGDPDRRPGYRPGILRVRRVRPECDADVSTDCTSNRRMGAPERHLR